MLIVASLVINVLGFVLVAHLLTRLFNKNKAEVAEEHRQLLATVQEMLHEVLDKRIQRDEESDQSPQPDEVIGAQAPIPIPPPDLPIARQEEPAVPDPTRPRESKVSYVYLPKKSEEQNRDDLKISEGEPFQELPAKRRIHTRPVEGIGGSRASDSRYQKTAGPRPLTAYSPKELERMKVFGRRWR